MCCERCACGSDFLISNSHFGKYVGGSCISVRLVSISVAMHFELLSTILYNIPNRKGIFLEKDIESEGVLSTVFALFDVLAFEQY